MDKKTNPSAVTSLKRTKNMYAIAMVLVCMVWGAGNTVSKIGMESIPPFLLLSIRFGVAFLIFVILFRGKIFKPFNKGNIRHCLILGVVSAFTYIFSILSLYFTQATISGFLMALSVLFTPFLNYLMDKKRIDRRILLVVGLVIIGMYLLCGGGGEFSFGFGEMLAFGTSICYAFWVVLTPKYIHDVGTVAISTMQWGVTAAICLPVSLIFEFPYDFSAIPTFGWFALAYITIFCTIIVYLVQNQSLKYLSPVYVSIVLCLEPLFTAITSYLMLGEILSLAGYAGGALIIVGLIIASFVEEQDQKNEDRIKEQVKD